MQIERVFGHEVKLTGEQIATVNRLLSSAQKPREEREFQAFRVILGAAQDGNGRKAPRGNGRNKRPSKGTGGCHRRPLFHRA